MKRIVSLLVSALYALCICAQSGLSCDDAIEVGYNYIGNVGKNTYWFTSNTNYLPLTFYYIPQNPATAAPEIWIDFTCTEGEYDDPMVASMVERAKEYDLTLPMQEQPEEISIDGKLAYKIECADSYRNMLYGQGVAYPISAFVRIESKGNAVVKITSDGIHSECSNKAMQLQMNSTLNITPADSASVLVWPIGEWVKEDYAISWSGANAKLYMGLDCEVTNESRVWQEYSLTDGMMMPITYELASEMVRNAHSPELYMRFYAEGEGELQIKPYKQTPYLQSMIVAGVQAVIDNEAMTITAILPKGTDRTEAIQNATFKPAVSPVTGEEPKLVSRGRNLQFGDLQYSVSNITVATDNYSHDATLKAILIDNTPLENFSSSVTEYENVGVESIESEITVQCSNRYASASMTMIESLPTTMQITVTAEAGNKMIYRLGLVQSLSTDATLEYIMLDGKEIEGFHPNIFNYTVKLTNIPRISVAKSDKNAKVSMTAAQTIPGVTRIKVEAQAGNVNYYSLNYEIDPSLIDCQTNSSALLLDQTYSIQENDTRIFSLPLEQIVNKNIQFLWKGQDALKVEVSSSCQMQQPELFSTFEITDLKGTTEKAAYFTPTNTNDWIKHSIDGNLYFSFTSSEQAELVFEEATEDCNVTSLLLNLPSQTTIKAGEYTTVYRLYLPDFLAKDISIKWFGEAEAELFFASDCNFEMNTTDPQLLPQGHIVLSADEEIIMTQETLNELNKLLNKFIYLKVFNGQTGTLAFDVIKDYNIDTGIENTTNNSAYARKVIINNQFFIIVAGENKYDILGNKLP